jgi:glycine/D-amino acid oxidase-like deaminating enzyme
LVQALTEELAGVTFFTGVEVVGYEESGPEVRVLTTEFSLRCKQLLICTNGFARQLLGDAADVVPARGQVLLTAPIPDLSLKGTFHYDQGYYYFRNLGNRVLLGGARNQAIEEETTTERVPTPLIQSALEHFLATHIPQASGVPITHRWAGIMGMGGEKRPLIQRLGEHITCAVRLSGVGVAISPLVGRQAAALVLG